MACKGTDRALCGLGVPIVDENDGGDYIRKKRYESTRPTSWILHEFAVHNLTYNGANLSIRDKGDSRIWALMDGAAGGDLSTDIGSARKRELPDR